MSIRVYGIWKSGGVVPRRPLGYGGDYIGTATDTPTALSLVDAARTYGCYAVSLHGSTEDGRRLSGEYLLEEAYPEIVPPARRFTTTPPAENYYAFSGRDG